MDAWEGGGGDCVLRVSAPSRFVGERLAGGPCRVGDGEGRYGPRDGEVARGARRSRASFSPGKARREARSPAGCVNIIRHANGLAALWLGATERYTDRYIRRTLVPELLYYGIDREEHKFLFPFRVIIPRGAFPVPTPLACPQGKRLRQRGSRQWRGQDPNTRKEGKEGWTPW